MSEKIDYSIEEKNYIRDKYHNKDHYIQFISEKIVYVYKDEDKKEIDENIFLSLNDIIPFFNRWFEYYYYGIKRRLSPIEIKNDLCINGRLGPQKGGVWVGMRIKTSNDEKQSLQEKVKEQERTILSLQNRIKELEEKS